MKKDDIWGIQFEVLVRLAWIDFIQYTPTLPKMDPLNLAESFTGRVSLHGHGILDLFVEVWRLISYTAGSYI